MKHLNVCVCLLGLIISSSCSQKEKRSLIIVKNTLDIERSFEIVELTKDFLKVEDLSALGIQDEDTGKLQVTQLVDTNDDGVMDQILFIPKVPANFYKKYVLVTIDNNQREKAPELCYSRFVPERIDDYTWENDKVAFRVYGPTAQKMVEDGNPSGTLSSGVDAWLKKVSYPIINKWYKKTTEGTGSYHKDTGEGLDNFHVGASRGVGGIAVKVDSSYYYSKNYVKYKTITTGPLRTSFYLEYEDWDAAGNTIKESRVMSLDLGNNLTRFIISLEGVNDIYSGLTLHDRKGIVSGDSDKGWLSYWEDLERSEIGTGIIAKKNTFLGFEVNDSNVKDLSNAYAHLKVENNQVVYYAGFGWKESGQFKNKEDWENYLGMFSRCINSPLIIELVP